MTKTLPDGYNRAMLQEMFARSIDEISYIYMTLQKKPPKAAAAVGSLQEYISMEGGEDPRRFFRNSGYVPSMEFSGHIRRRKYNIQNFSFDSEVYSMHASNRKVYGRLYDRHGEPDAPLVLVLHGWRMDTYMLFDRYCRIFVNEGFNCALPDLPYHMNRTPGGSFAGEYTFADDGIHTMETLRQAVFDVMAIMNWAKENRGVRRIGVMGVSFGAMLTGLMACMEPMVDFAVMVAPPVDLGKMFTGSRLGRVFESENPKAERMLRLYKDMLSRIALQNMKPLTKKERIFIAEGLYDGMVPPPLVEELWGAWEHPEIRRYPHGHLSVILFNPALERDMKHWIRALDAVDK